MKRILIIVTILIIVGGIISYFILKNINAFDELESKNENGIPSEEEVEGNTNNNLREEEDDVMRIQVSDGNHNIIFELNDSDAAISLYNQLPLEIEVENYSSNEKIFYPPTILNTSNTPLASGGLGILAYYAPWGDIVMFYDDFRVNSSLYELGRAVTGEDEIQNLSGNITIERVEEE